MYVLSTHTYTHTHQLRSCLRSLAGDSCHKTWRQSGCWEPLGAGHVGIAGSSGERYAGQLVIGLKHLKALFGVGASVEVISDAGWTSSMC